MGAAFARRGYVLLLLFRRSQGLSASHGANINEVLERRQADSGAAASDRLQLRLLETDHLDDAVAGLTAPGTTSDGRDGPVKRERCGRHPTLENPLPRLGGPTMYPAPLLALCLVVIGLSPARIARSDGAPRADDRARYPA